jgi:hypothetical protein
MAERQSRAVTRASTWAATDDKTAPPRGRRKRWFPGECARDAQPRFHKIRDCQPTQRWPAKGRSAMGAAGLSSGQTVIVSIVLNQNSMGNLFIFRCHWFFQETVHLTVPLFRRNFRYESFDACCSWLTCRKIKPTLVDAGAGQQSGNLRPDTQSQIGKAHRGTSACRIWKNHCDGTSPSTTGS